MTPQQKEKITNRLQDELSFHYLSVDIDGLKTRKWQIGLLRSGLTL